MSNTISCQFSPRGLGIDVIQDSSSTHFRDDPIPKMIREVLQNPLDAKIDGLLDPVEVTIADTRVEPKTIGAEELKLHLIASSAPASTTDPVSGEHLLSLGRIDNWVKLG